MKFWTNFVNYVKYGNIAGIPSVAQTFQEAENVLRECAIYPDQEEITEHFAQVNINTFISRLLRGDLVLTTEGSLLGVNNYYNFIIRESEKNVTSITIMESGEIITQEGIFNDLVYYTNDDGMHYFVEVTEEEK